mmetsp:Transcript_58040/g.62720  ORF Transcript_58040/g.62720 Transcript_58040/m.62720 type:complete len:121 (+) Transcript_58040:229-591(+)
MICRVNVTAKTRNNSFWYIRRTKSIGTPFILIIVQIYHTKFPEMVLMKQKHRDYVQEPYTRTTMITTYNTNDYRYITKVKKREEYCTVPNPHNVLLVGCWRLIHTRTTDTEYNYTFIIIE